MIFLDLEISRRFLRHKKVERNVKLRETNPEERMNRRNQLVGSEEAVDHMSGTLCNLVGEREVLNI
jgi:hypothetical protein